MVLATLALSLNLSAIFAQSKLTSDDVAQFFQTTTCVVLDNNLLSGYNIEIENAVKKEWKITPFEIISWEEFDKRKLDKKYSFLVISQVVFDRDKNPAKYDFLSLVVGGQKKLIDMPDLCPFPLAYSGVDEDSYLFKINTIVMFIQQHITMLKDNPEYVNANLFKHYNDNLSDIQGKTICFLKEELAPNINTVQKIAKYYKGDVKIVSREELHELIKNNADIVFLHKVGPEGTRLASRCYKVLMGAKDAKLYYFDYHKIDGDSKDAFLLSDIKKMAK
jgi:hypothetical protein